MRIATPDSLFRWLIDKLPKSAGDLIWNVTYCVAWITLPLWFVDTLADIQAVVTFISLIMERVTPSIRLALLWMYDLMHPALVAWRTLVAPLHSWLSAVLPFDVPEQVTETVLAFLPAAPALLRVFLARRRHAEAFSRAQSLWETNNEEYEDEDEDDPDVRDIRDEGARLYISAASETGVGWRRLMGAHVLLAVAMILGLAAALLEVIGFITSR
jgi:hypothetical protein